MKLMVVLKEPATTVEIPAKAEAIVRKVEKELTLQEKEEQIK
jgi:hypothetical protein